MARKWTEQPLDNTLKETDQLLRLDLDEADPAVQNRRATHQAYRQWLDIAFTQEMFVDPQATYTTYADGTIARPYNTVQAAINAITDASASKKYVIVLTSGELTGAVALKKYISLRGSGKYTTRIIGNVTISTTDIGDIELSELSIQGNLTLVNAGTVSASLALKNVLITGTTVLSGRGAGSDDLEINGVTFNTGVTLQGFDGRCQNCVFNGALGIEDAGTVVDSNGDYTSILVTDNEIGNNLDVTAAAGNPVYVVLLNNHTLTGVFTLTGNDTTVMFDATSFPLTPIVTGAGTPTVLLRDDAENVSADLSGTCLVSENVNDALIELASYICASPAPDLTFDPANTILVGKLGSFGVDAYTIKSGLALASLLSPTSSNPVSVIVYPGLYDEEPLVVPDYVTLTTAGGLGSVIINTDDPENIALQVGSDCEVNGFLIQGATGLAPSLDPSPVISPSLLDSAIGILVQNQANTLIRSCIITNCENAIVLDKATGCIITDVIFNNSPVRPVANALIVRNDSIAIVQSCAFLGTPISKFEIAIMVDDSNLTLATNTIQFAECGLVCYGDANVLPSTTLFNYCDAGLKLYNNTVLRADSCTISNCTVDIEILSANIRGHFVGSASLNSIIGLGISNDFFISIMQSTEGDEGIKLIGELSVGAKERPSESAFGEGDSSVVGMHVLTNTNLEAGTWDDITTEAASPSGSRFDLFANIVANNALYIGVDDYQFHGVKIEDILSAFDGTGTIDTQYWTGSWDDVNVMETDANAPYDQRANNVLEENTSIQIRFGALTGWTKKTLNGIEAYWFRIVLTVAPTSGDPSAERIKYHTHRSEINNDGLIEYFGNARKQRPIALSPLYEIDGFAPGDFKVEYGVNTKMKVLDNKRGGGGKDGSGGFFRVPEGLDTSLPIKFRIFWAVDGIGTGDVEHEIYIGKLENGLVLDGLNTEVVSKVIDTVSVAADLEIKITEIELEIPSALTTEAYVWVHIRDGSGGNPDDTLGDDIFLASWTLSGYFWR